MLYSVKETGIFPLRLAPCSSYRARSKGANARRGNMTDELATRQINYQWLLVAVPFGT
jgi:hypothetical protein